MKESIVPAEVNVDVGPYYLGTDKVRFIRNLDLAQFAGRKDGENALAGKPLPSVDIYDPTFRLPAGTNRTVGRKVSRETESIFVFVWNSQHNHLIYRIRRGRCEVVLRDPRLNFQLDPVHYISEGRCSVIAANIGGMERTFLAWTDGHPDNTQGFVCVEDAIATNSFDPALYSRLRSPRDRRELFSLGLAAPWDCIRIAEDRPTGPASPATINKLKYNTWQFRISYVDVYGRPSEHGVISDLYYQSECAGEQAGCLNLTFDAGGPLVEKIFIERRRNCSTEWQRHEAISKYDNCEKPWYERKVSSKINFNATANTITYKFCADKECIPVPDVESQRVENPMPLVSESLFNLRGGLALAGNTYGRKPFACDVMDKVSFEVEKPTITPSTALVTRNIVVWAVVRSVHNRQKLQCVWRQNDRNVFGGVDGDDLEDGVAGKYRQHFSEPDQEGWIGHLQGTGYTTISKQYRLTGLTALQEAQALLGMPVTVGEWTEFGVTDRDQAKAVICLQRFEFKNVEPGRYVFQIANHTVGLNQDYKSTSTYYAGHRPMNGRVPRLTGAGTYARQMVVDVCEKDFDSMDSDQIVEIWDLTHAKGFFTERRARVSFGYVYETNEGEDGRIPIMGAPVIMNVSGDSESWSVGRTDHNGFWFTTAKDKDHEVFVEVMRKCRREREKVVNWDKSDGSGVKTKTLFATSIWADFQKEECNRIRIQGKVVDCDTGVGLRGVLVVLTNGGGVLTNRDGEYEIITHDFEPIQAGPFGPTTGQADRLFFYSGGKCRVSACDGGRCLPALPISRPACSSCTERVYDAGSVRVRTNSSKQAGPQLGGRYGFGIKGADWMDRKNFVQTDPRFYLDIPTANEIGGFAYPRIKWKFDPSIRFPAWVKKIYFNWTKNLRYSDFLSWVVDRFELIDNTGKVNEVSPTQIRIYYSSLGEYNKQYNFSTNSTWQVIDEKESIRTSDTVHFVANGGESAPFQKVITELVKFDKEGRYFHVDYNPDLADLKEGALIKLMRENECKETELFYEVCQTIDVVDGVPKELSGYLNVYDSFFVPRQIPTPITSTKKKKKAVPNSDPLEYEEVEESVTTNVLRTYGWPFEHHSPSDSWGTKCSNRGRVGVKNEYENVMVKDEIAWSGVLGENGIINYLHYFDERMKKVFSDRKRGGIVSCIVEGNIVLVICENDHFIVPFDDNTVRISEDGTARANIGDNQFGKPQRKAGQNFGCRRKDRNTIDYYNGVVHWLDSDRVADVYHNFGGAVDISVDRYKSFLRRKVKSVQKSSGRYFHSHFNPKDGRCYTTDFSLADPHFNVRNDLDINIDSNETFSIDAAANAHRGFFSFTPEMYASFPGEERDEQFFSFIDGRAYYHYRPNATSFNVFYGSQRQRACRVVVGTEPLRSKSFFSFEVYVDNVCMYAHEVLTEQNQKSRTPRNWMKRGDKYWVGPFLCDEHTYSDPNFGKERTTNVLFGGEKLRGRWIEVLLVGDPANLEKYSELTAIIINTDG